MPLRFSIVIPTFNRKRMLADALASVRAQNWPDVEIIIVDGASTDGTVEQFEHDTSMRFLKGPDRGVYDALNKGIAAANGEIVGLLNSDDMYEPGTFTAVAEAFADPAAQAVCGSAILVEGGRTLAVFDNPEDMRLASPRTVFIGSCIPNARFFRRPTLSKIGPFSLDYRFVADRDFLARWYEAGLKTVAIPRQVYRYRQHQGSLTFDAGRSRETEIRQELLRLARVWRNSPAAGQETRATATLLEGKCLAWLILHTAKMGNLREAALFVFSENGRLSTRPITAMQRAIADRFRQ